MERWRGFGGSTIKVPKQGGNKVLVVKPRLRKLNKKQKTQVKRIVGNLLEHLQFPFYRNAVNVSTTAGIVDCETIGQGITHITRTASEIHMSRIEFSYGVTVADADNAVRVMMIQWKDNTDLRIPTEALLFQDALNAIPYSYYNFDEYPGSFNVLYDRIHRLSTAGPGVQGAHVIVNPKKFKKIVKYNGSATTGTGKIYLIYWSDSDAVTHPTLKLYGVITYTDG